jgi:hypothetical protein
MSVGIEYIISQISYLDHENDTDVAYELTNVIKEIKTEGMSAEEGTALIEERFSQMKANGLFEEPEHEQLVQEFVEQLPSLLFS